jgi:hypothetical protein
MTIAVGARRTPVSDKPPDVSRVLAAMVSPKKREVPADVQTTLRRAVQVIFDAERRAGGMPRRAVLRRNLLKIETAAKTIARLVCDPSIVQVEPRLHGVFGPPAFDEAGLDVPGAMNRLVRLATRCRQRIRTGAGRANAGPSFGEYGGRELCALIIVQAWQRMHGRAPSPKNDHAQEACAALWEAACQQPNSIKAKRGDVTEGAAWERHLKAARALDPSRLQMARSDRLAARETMIYETAASMWLTT